jgi:hypothetical protein
MSGIPRYNIPMFDEAAERLRANGYTVISPAELDDPGVRDASYASLDGKASSGKTWGEFLARDIQIVADEVSGIILLPGWQNSRGAKLEVYAGLLCGHQFRIYHGTGQAAEIGAPFVRTFIR